MKRRDFAKRLSYSAGTIGLMPLIYGCSNKPKLETKLTKEVKTSTFSVAEALADEMYQ